MLAVVIAAAPSVSTAAGPTERPTGIVASHTDEKFLAVSERLEAVSEPFNALRAAKGALGLYRRDDGAVVVVVPASGSSTFKAADARELGVDVVIERRDIERSDIVAIKKDVAASKWVPRDGSAYPMAYFDPRTGKVTIVTDAPKEEFAGLLAQHPGKIEFSGQGAARLSRMEDYEDHWGGARMISPQLPGNWCTSGFSVLNSNGNPRMVTASHCWDLGWTVNSPQGDTFGTVMRRDSFPTNDFELVGGGGVGQGGSIYVGLATGTQLKVADASNPAFGVLYGFSGAISYENCCFQLVDDDIPFEDAAGVTTHTMLFVSSPGDGPCGGDSGAPVFRYRADGRAGIKGIVIAGDSFFPSSRCAAEGNRMWIEKWSKIRDTYGVTLVTDP